MFETFIAIGIIISLIYTEITDLSPGGMITPGYIALFIDQPMRIIATLFVAFITYFIIKIFKKHLAIYGRRQFAFAVITAILLKLTLGKYIFHSSDISLTINSIGVIIPGLIANDMEKQSVDKTLISILLVSSVLLAILMIINKGVY